MERANVKLRKNKRREELLEGDFIGTPGAVISELEIPSWYDEKKFNRAKELYRDNFVGVNFGLFCGLLLALYFPKLSKIFYSTGKTSEKNSCFIRFIKTTLYVKNWFESDIWDVNDSAHQYLSIVRSMHTIVGKKMAALNDGVVYMSQWDMVIVQWAMVGPAALFQTLFGLHGWSNDDYDAMFHFWRNIGYLLGIEDKYNLCQGSYDEVFEVCENLLHNDFKPMMLKADPVSVTMAENIAESASMVLFFFKWPPMATYIYKLVDIPCPVDMGIFDSICYSLICFMTYLMKFSRCRNIMNKFYRWKLNCNERKIFQMLRDKRS